MAITFFYHDPLDDNNGGSSHVMCEASCEGQRTGPYSAKLKVWTRMVAKKGTSSQKFEYNIIIDNTENNNGEDVHRTVYESFSAGKEWNFYDEIDFNVNPEDTRISAYFYAFRYLGGGEGDNSGYEGIANAYIPAWITAPTVSDPVITDTKINQISFSWNVTDSGGEDPVLHTEIYNYPGHTSSWVDINDLGYGYISVGTIMGLNRYSSYAIRGKAVNSFGSTTSREIWFRTLQEPPSVGSVLISNIMSESARYSFAVVDNGGKPVEKYALYIHGGQYSDWTKVSDSNTGTLVSLLHNTNYSVRGYATNDSVSQLNPDDEKFTGFASATFKTSGNAPTIEKFKAEIIEKNKIVLEYFASYDLNASFKSYIIQYKENGASSWISLDSNSRIINNLKSNQQYDVRISVTDNFDRTSVSEISLYTLGDKINIKTPQITISGDNVIFTEDFILPSNSSLRIVENSLFMKIKDGNENIVHLKSFGSGNEIRTFTFNNKDSETYMHPYKEYSF